MNDLLRENAELKARVEDLEKRLLELGIAFTIVVTAALETSK
jgi:hypothetical protein